MKNRILCVLTIAVTLAITTIASAQTTIVSDNFNRSGDLDGDTVTTGGQMWMLSTKGETGGRTLTTGNQFGQGGTHGKQVMLVF